MHKTWTTDDVGGWGSVATDAAVAVSQIGPIISKQCGVPGGRFGGSGVVQRQTVGLNAVSIRGCVSPTARKSQQWSYRHSNCSKTSAHSTEKSSVQRRRPNSEEATASVEHAVALIGGITADAVRRRAGVERLAAGRCVASVDVFGPFNPTSAANRCSEVLCVRDLGRSASRLSVVVSRRGA
jgi:hypothetical protein